jgi:hypothetical protein
MNAFEGVVSLGSFMGSMVVGRISVAWRESIDVRSGVSGPGLSPCGRLASITLQGCMKRV